MNLCQFSYTRNKDATFSAVCEVCGRKAVTRTQNAHASCRAFRERSAVTQLMQAAGVVDSANGGPGTELHAILRDWLGVVPTEDCPCRSMAARMDALGVAWCLSDSGMAEILNVMRAEHGKRWADGRTRLPWTDLGAKTLVRLACRRAEAKASSGQ